jgi:hypothetical protein
VSTTPGSAIERALNELSALSFVAHRDALGAMPAIRRHGEAETLQWLDVCRRLTDFDREAGKAFIRGSADAEEASEEVRSWTEQAAAFLRWRGAWRVMEGFMHNLPRAYDALGHAGEARWADIGMQWCERHIESGTAYFATPLRDMAGPDGIVGIEQIAAAAEELYASRKLMLGTYLAGAIRVRNLFGSPAILPWALRGADIMQAGRLRGEAYFRLESEESLALLLENLPGFRMNEHQRLLTLLLDVWYGKSVAFKDSTWSPEKGRAFVECDGRTLFLPAVVPDRNQAILGVVHAAGHMAFGSYERASVEQIFRAVGVELPADGPVSWAPLYAFYGEDWLRFQLIFDGCEDLRVDTRIADIVPNHLTRMLAASHHYGAPDAAVRPYYEWAQHTIELAIAFRKGDPVAAARDGRPPDARLLRLLSPQATLMDAFDAARSILRDGVLPPVADSDAMYSAYLPGRSPNMARVTYTSEQARPNPQTQASRDRDAEQQEGGNRRNSSDNDTEAGDRSGAERRDQLAGEGNNPGSARRSRNAMAQQRERPADERGRPYPEWDYREARYKRNWSWVQERPLGERNLSEAQRLETQYAAVLKRLKRAIQAQKPTRLAPQMRQFEGDDIDINAAVAYLTEKRAGVSPDPDIYRRRRLKQRDVAVTLLADMSTSIMQHLPEGGGRLVDRVRAGVLLFAESMEEVGDAYSIAGFCSKYRDNVSYFMIKDFAEPFTGAVRGMIGGMSGRLATRMGAAIRHATTRFQGVAAQRRLLLLLSDGRPEDYDDGGDRRYLHEDTRMAVKEAVAKGVHPFCITVDTMANQYLPQIFGNGHYLVLDHINSLPNKLPEIYLRLRR